MKSGFQEYPLSNLDSPGERELTLSYHVDPTCLSLGLGTSMGRVPARVTTHEYGVGRVLWVMGQWGFSSGWVRAGVGLVRVTRGFLC